MIAIEEDTLQLGSYMMKDAIRFSPDLLSAPAEQIFYALTMFAYPSGIGLHCGHASIFTINDVIARYKRMQGFTVFNPVGFDAFGLPTENYAMQIGKAAYEATDENIAMFVDQIKALNISFDRERVIDTSKPDYYKWTQRIFSKLYEAGLVYRAELRVNRCPSCQTVLANDQVVDGKCERCKTEVVQKKMPQWFIKITAYADRLINDLDLVDRPQETITTQRNWIGRSEGAEIDFVAHHHDATTKITVFTTRPDTLYGVTAVVLAPENTLIDSLIDAAHREELDKYRQQTFAKTPVQRQQELKEKSGVFSGVYAKHPLTGKDIPIRFADYVLADYGSGAVMMVPAHDERDFEFAKKFGIEVKAVIAKRFVFEGDSALRDNIETVHKRVVDVILENDKGEILVIKEKSPEDVHFIGGGIEEGETELEAVKREIMEESGYTDFEIVAAIDGSSVESVGYRHTKQKNQISYGRFFHAKLTSNNQIKSEVDDGKHTLHRLPKDKVLDLVNRPAHYFAYESFLVGGRAYTDEGTLINSGEFDGVGNRKAIDEIVKKLEYLGMGGKRVMYKLRDRSVSRQRYRGSPIPVYYKEPTDMVPLYEYEDAERKHKPGQETLTRQVIQVIVKDKNSDEYCFIKRNHDGDVSGFFGGIEEGETADQAAERELLEEGGFTSIEVKKHILEYHCKFWHPTKKRNQYSICNCLYVEVDRNNQQEISKEEQAQHSLVWMSAEEFLKISNNDTTKYALRMLLGIDQPKRPLTNKYNEFNICPEDQKIPCLIPENELPVILPLDVQNYKPKGKSPLEEHEGFKNYTPPNYKVPYFEYTDGIWGIRKEIKHFVRREVVHALIKHPTEEKYLTLRWKLDNSLSFVAGGIDGGETHAQALVKEIKEEAGYTDFQIKQNLGGEIHRQFYHAGKGFNQYGINYFYLVQLNSLDQVALDPSELAIHTPEWNTLEDIQKDAGLDPDALYVLSFLTNTPSEPAAWIDRFNEYNPLTTYHRECDTLDTFMCSAFYFLRFPDAHNPNELIRKELADKMFPVDLYTGGKEHTVGHLLYSRFVHKFLYDQGYVPSPEPFAKLVHQGYVLGSDGRKMGKRYNNGVDPVEMVQKYGADALRTYLMFMGPVDQDKAWNDNALLGMKKFLDRVARLLEVERRGTFNEEVDSVTHQTIRDLSKDLEEIKLNTAVSKLMILTNAMYDHQAVTDEQLKYLALLLAPFATDLATHIWKTLGHTDDIHYASWPVADEKKIVQGVISLPVQINGKMRGNIDIRPGTDEAAVIALVQANENFAKYLEGVTIKKIIYVQDKILNLVVG